MRKCVECLGGLAVATFIITMTCGRPNELMSAHTAGPPGLMA